MVRHPILINRAVLSQRLGGVALSRPSEKVLDILPLPQMGPFAEEDGEPVINEEGKRVERTCRTSSVPPWKFPTGRGWQTPPFGA